MHFKVCKEALEAGKHVLLEKPLTLKYSEAVELVKLAKSKKLILAVGHIFRFNNAIRKAKEMVDSGEFGRIYLLKLTWTNLEPIWNNRDILFDLGAHPFDIVNFLFGKNPEEISCIGEVFRKPFGEEAAFVNGKIGHILINLEMSWVTPEKTRRLVIVGEKKTVFIDCLSQETKVFDLAAKTLTDAGVIPSNTIRLELEHFLQCIEKKEINFADGAIGAEMIRIIEIAKKSLDEKKVLKIPKI
jgi:predicted dehydrogenase